MKTINYKLAKKLREKEAKKILKEYREMKNRLGFNSMFILGMIIVITLIVIIKII